jgi:hypothetical protein
VAAASATLGPAAIGQARDPILFVHGFASTGATWNTMIDRSILAAPVAARTSLTRTLHHPHHGRLSLRYYLKNLDAPDHGTLTRGPYGQVWDFVR